MTGLTSPLHIAILFLLVILLFGAKRLPEIGRGLGTGMREFKDSVTGHDIPGITSELPHADASTAPQPETR